MKKKSTAMMQPMSEKDWEAEEDLRAMARAHAVKSDPERMKRCKAMAKTRLEENKKRRDEAQMMMNMAKE